MPLPITFIFATFVINMEDSSRKRTEEEQNELFGPTLAIPFIDERRLPPLTHSGLSLLLSMFLATAWNTVSELQHKNRYLLSAARHNWMDYAQKNETKDRKTMLSTCSTTSLNF
ncbi:unnamed protein product [Caenorhabditis auriculariae]|uniref:Uncharacterized protein n=1 Tax=Caenorhabditis auriculariae TaxID=2777116 RepID=A0A8S1H7N7_9PELO|nr:unnamed protein product [Caenorhabditis auriculariae]